MPSPSARRAYDAGCDCCSCCLRALQACDWAVPGPAARLLSPDFDTTRHARLRYRGGNLLQVSIETKAGGQSTRKQVQRAEWSEAGDLLSLVGTYAGSKNESILYQRPGSAERVMKPAAKKKASKPKAVYPHAEALARYEKLTAKHGVERKGAKNPYTSANGNMFSFLTAEGELALRLSRPDREAFEAKHGERPCVQYGAVMREYVLLPAEVFHNTRQANRWFAKSVQYAATLKPKATKKKK